MKPLYGFISTTLNMGMYETNNFGFNFSGVGFLRVFV